MSTIENLEEYTEKKPAVLIINDKRVEKREAEENKEKIRKDMIESQKLREENVRPKDVGNKSLTSFIEPHEEQEAKDFVESQLGFKAPKVCGYYMSLKVFVRGSQFKPLFKEDGSPVLLPDGTPAIIELPNSVTAHDKHRSYVGLVVAQGSDCYKGERFKESGPWCKVGDWVVFGRHDGPHFQFKGTPFAMIPDDKVYMVVEDPEDVVRE